MKLSRKKPNLFLPSVFVIAFILSGICFLSHNSGTGTYISKGFSFVTAPLNAGARRLSLSFSSVGKYFSDVKKITEENEKLKKENEELKSENNRLAKVDAENNELYNFLELKREHVDYSLAEAKIIARSDVGCISSFTLNKGSFHGITEAMPIVTSNGTLLGVTYSVDVNSCKCRALTSYDTYVGVYSEECGETGLLSGSFETFSAGKCVISGLSDDTKIKVGDTILTSGLGEVYPRDLKIGTVDSFIKDLGSQTQSAVVTLDKTISDESSVMLITAFNREYK